jgi:hypothetical protein
MSNFQVPDNFGLFAKFLSLSSSRILKFLSCVGLKPDEAKIHSEEAGLGGLVMPRILGSYL